MKQSVGDIKQIVGEMKHFFGEMKQNYGEMKQNVLGGSPIDKVPTTHDKYLANADNCWQRVNIMWTAPYEST